MFMYNPFKSHMKVMGQRDPKWSRERLGDSVFSVYQYGCLITSLCMVHSGFYPKTYITPLQASKEWKFTNEGHLDWYSDFQGFKLKERGRVRKYDKTHYHAVASHANNPYLGVVVQVDNYHWCVVERAYLGQLIIIDPWTEKRQFFFNSPYKAITGYALLAK